MPINDDSLDIQPILPVGATPWTPDFAFGDGVLNPGGDKNPEAAAAARAKLASVHGLHAYSEPAKAAYEPAIQPAAEPVSPAHHEQVKKRRLNIEPKHINMIKPVLNALAAFALLVLIFKAPVFYNQIKFGLTKPAAEQTTAPSGIDTPITVSPEPVLMIPKINVKAPIIFEPSIEEAKVNKALEAGVVHYGITAKPGEVGNAVITGHSSNDWWQPGGYKFVFVLLGKLVPGDPVLVNYQGVQYKYEVTERKIVEANDVSVLAPTGEPTITLLTCWPVGTNLKREIIRAKQVSPIPSANAPAKIAKTPDTRGFILPGSSKSLSQQIGDFWNSITGAFSQKPTDVKPE